jgi:hypothetical protein
VNSGKIGKNPNRFNKFPTKVFMKRTKYRGKFVAAFAIVPDWGTCPKNLDKSQNLDD